MASLDDLLAVLNEIALWTKAGSFNNVEALLSRALPDQKARMVYQLTDGTLNRDQIRTACKVSPNYVSQLWQRCGALGIMAADDAGKRLRSFNLLDFGLITQAELDLTLAGARTNE